MNRNVNQFIQLIYQLIFVEMEWCEQHPFIKVCSISQKAQVEIFKLKCSKSFKLDRNVRQLPSSSLIEEYF